MPSIKQFFVVFVVSVLGVSACGRPTTSDVKIVGGHAAGAHPYFVQLLTQRTSPEGFCGGTLIAPRLVLTAAHCIEPKVVQDLHVALGFEDGTSLHLTHPVRVVGIALHPEYGGMAEFGNDLALLYLEPYKASQFAKPVAPVGWERNARTAVPKTLRAVGLGQISSLGDVRTHVVQEVDLPVVPPVTCAQRYDVTNKQICAGDWKLGGVDSCNGDSGGPLLHVNEQGAATLVGVVSYGRSCAQSGNPGVYTKVAAYRDWIDQQSKLLQKELSPTSPVKDLPRVISQRCLAQANGLTHQVVQNRHKRETVWRLDSSRASFVAASQEPKGELLAECVFRDGAKRNVQVRWHRSMEDDEEATAFVRLPSGTTYLSSAMPLKYVADTLRCETARGPVALYDTRGVSYIQYRDQLYTFGEPTSDPNNNQTTSGCHIGNAALEIFESKIIRGKLAVRVTHSSVGTIVRFLERAEQPLAAMLNAKISDVEGQSAKFTLSNPGTRDLFTWQLDCLRKFTLVLKDGTRLTSKPRPSGSGFSLLVDQNEYPEGTLLHGKSFSRRIEFTDPIGFGLGCSVNSAFPVDEVTYASSRR